MIKGMGGAMELANKTHQVIVTMEHTDHGYHKFLEKCSLPLTGSHVVDMAITEMAVFKWDRNTREMMLIEIAPGHSIDEVIAATGCKFLISPNLKEY